MGVKKKVPNALYFPSGHQSCISHARDNMR